MAKEKPTFRNPWAWVPTIYFAQGIPYVVVMLVSVIMYKRLGISNTDIALYTSWLYLPWVIKPLWSPLVDLVKTKRAWIIAMQLVVGAGLGGVALTIPMPDFFTYSLAFLWLLAFSSATHDIAADGFYMLGLSKHDQAWFVGVRSTFYRIAMITGQGLLIILAGYIESNSGLDTVNVQVSTNSAVEQTMFTHPDSLTFDPVSNGDLRIITYPDILEISTERVQKEYADSLIAFSRRWNTSHNFYQAELLDRQTGDARPATGMEASWWNRFVASPLESFLRRNFGPPEDEMLLEDTRGNLGVVYFRLSGPPPADEEVVVNFGRESGDTSISLIEGERFVITQNNWTQPVMTVIQIDPKLDFATSANFAARSGNIPLAWSITFFLLCGMFLFFFVYHKLMLPYPVADKPAISDGAKSIFTEFFRTFALFFRKDRILVIIAFLLLYRLGEAQLVKLASPFLLDTQEVGGLALTTGEVGFVYGTVGILALTFGGILGGIMAARHGLKFWLWPMVIAINLPNAVYIYLATAMPSDFLIINICVAIEQFGYGFGFTAYMLFMIYVSEGEHKTAHFAITTGFMALGMMIPGMVSGWIQEIIGYQNFFIWVLIATIPAFIITYFIPLDPEFGKKKEGDEVPGQPDNE
jgi:MFS transporter, PAT family, beta-lactamase induction signal transducer AmpG